MRPKQAVTGAKYRTHCNGFPVMLSVLTHGETMPEKNEYGTAANHYVSSLYHAAIKQSVDAENLLRECELSPDCIDNPRQRIPTEKLAAFQKRIWDATGDESMGLNGCRMKSGSYFMMGKLTVHQPTLGKALALGKRFYNLLIADNFIELEETPEQVILRVNPVNPACDPDHLFAEITLLAWHRYASWLIADCVPLTETRFPYPAPAHINEYAYLYPGKHIFEHHELALVFPAQFLQYPVKQNEASLQSFMQRCPLELFRQYQSDYSLTTELRRMLNKQIMDNTASINDFSAALHMTSRTLMRKLKDEGTSFQQLKDIVRRDKAVQLLVQTELPVSEVAERVGYSDSAVFTRAFRAWTGATPRRYREQQTSV